MIYNLRKIFPFMSRRSVLTALCFAVSLLFSAANAFTLIIDPGHGGKDFGARGKISNEKTINLKVAKQLEALIKEKHPEVTTVFTRPDDSFVSLQDRAKIANKANGDLFVSIHVNSVDRRNKRRTSINGASVYTLGLHKSADNLEVAKRENAVMALEPDYEQRYEGFDPESAESYIIFELSQNKHFEQSVKLADDIQNELIETAGRADKGVRQAGFWVLWSTTMPSVLVELDFICNPVQEKFLASEKGQKKMAEAIFNAVSRYISSNGSTSFNRSAKGSVSEISDEDKGKYTVVFLTTSTELKPHDAALKHCENVYHSSLGALHRYCTEPVGTPAKANSVLKEIKESFPDAFVTKIK